MPNLNIRIDEDIRDDAVEIFKNYDLTTSAAIRLFFIQTIECGGLPFEMQSSKAKKEDSTAGSYLPKATNPMDIEYRRKADAVCKELGITLEQAINMLIRSIARRS